MRKLSVKAVKGSCLFASVRVQFMQRISFLFWLLHLPGCNSDSTGRSFFMQLFYSSGSAHPCSEEQSQRHYLSRRRESLTWFSGNFTEVHVKGGVR